MRTKIIAVIAIDFISLFTSLICGLDFSFIFDFVEEEEDILSSFAEEDFMSCLLDDWTLFCVFFPLYEVVIIDMG
jgi:hypothetical protein